MDPTNPWRIAEDSPDEYADWQDEVASGDTTLGWLAWREQRRPTCRKHGDEMPCGLCRFEDLRDRGDS